MYEDEIARLATEFGDEAKARALAREDRALIRFYVPEGCAWAEVRANANRLGEWLTDTPCAILLRRPALR